MSTDPESYLRDHDHRAEALIDALIENPTPENACAAGLAVAKLQRAYDHVLRRLDDSSELPEFPVHAHNAADSPEVCASAALEELAGAKLADRAATLAHGLEALNALARRLEAAQDWATEAQARHHALENRCTDEIAQLRRDLSEARSWAWAEVHGSWNENWFPATWRPRTPEDGLRPPDWLRSAQQPHRQDWWTPPGAVIQADLAAFAAHDEGTVRVPAHFDVAVGDALFLTDGTTYLAVAVTSITNDLAAVAVRWRGERE